MPKVVHFLLNENKRMSVDLVVYMLSNEFYFNIFAAEINQICKPLFTKSVWLRPKATRPSSREIYLICQGLKPEIKI